MDALVMDTNGICELVDMPEPRLGKGQVVIEVGCAAFNKADYAQQQSHRMGPGEIDMEKAHILGSDVAGVVTAVSPDVRGFQPGDRVCAECKGLKGGMARLALADAKWTAKIPDEMSLAVAATIPTAGVTALAAVKKASAVGGGHVLVCGASGGVGQYVTLFASQAGMAVDALCSARSADIAKRCGAMQAYDYKDGLSSIPEGGYDAVFAVNGKYPASEYARLLRRGGTYVAVGMDSIRPALGMPIRGKQPRLAIFFAEINRGGLVEAVQRAASSTRSIAITTHEGLEAVPTALAELADAHDGTRHVVLI